MTTQLTKAKDISFKHLSSKPRITFGSFYDHSQNVVNNLLSIKVQDENLLIAAYLHHIPLDSPVFKEFDTEVYTIVQDFLKFNSISDLITDPQNLENEKLINIYLSLSQNPKALLLRLADKTAGVKSAHALSEPQRTFIAQKALYIYAPLCKLTGIYQFQKILEDNGFKILSPNEYNIVVNLIEKKITQYEHYITTVKKIISEVLDDQNYFYELFGRVKHPYSVYKKFQTKNYKMNDIKDYIKSLHDLIAVRIIVNTVDECYEVETLLHDIFDFQYEKRDDYIKNPRPTGYQSIHNECEILDGVRMEFQIRTFEMHEYNEYGPASHIMYKLGPFIKEAIKKNPNILKDYNYKNLSTSSDIVPMDDKVYVFSPKGEIISLKQGATILDYAFEIHTDIGMHFIRGYVNNKIVTKDHKLTTGDYVLIDTSKKVMANTSWLDATKTKKAHIYIKSYLKKQENEDSAS